MKEENIVTVTMFGKFTISYQGKKISERVAPVENQSWRMLKYILVNAGRGITMEELAQELSAEGEEAAVANNLRVRLSRMRDILGDLGLGSVKNGLILFGDGQFWVNGDYQIVTDRDKIDWCYVSMADQKTPREGKLGEYIDGLACFNGIFLENSRNSFWIGKARAHYDKVYLQLLDFCMEAMAETGDYSRADVVLNGALRLKPWELDVHDRLLRGLLKQNRIAEAATYYAKLAVLFANTELRLPEFNYFMN